MRLLIENLFQQVLIEPAKRNKANKLFAVSGYVTANMAYKHMESLGKSNSQSSIAVIAGMTPIQGVNKAHHEQFVKFSQKGVHGSKFSCKYVASDNPVHAKVFIWVRNDNPVIAFAGSANYTNTGFSEKQNEAMTHVDPDEALDFYNQTIEQTVDCLDPEVGNKISIKIQQRTPRTKQETPKIPQYEGEDVSADSVTLSLLMSKRKEIHKSGGLNWGYRSNIKRNRNQAYIPVPSEVRKRNFFPKRGEPFIVSTDDGESFILVAAQDGDKALETPEDNSILGRYFRKRLQLESGQFVEKRHLLEYGRTNVTFTKRGDETYFMDFGTDPEK